MRIEYEDKDIIVVYKEAGLPVQSGRTSARDLVSMLKNHLAKEEQTSRKESGIRDRDRASDRQPAGKHAEPYLGIVHRLDQPVEGLLVFAKTPKAAAALSRQAAAKGEDARDESAAGKAAGGESAGGESSGGKSAKQGNRTQAMEKVYRAVVLITGEAYPLALEGRKREVLLTDWILRDYSNNTAFVAEEGARDAKRAQLTFRTLEIKDGKAMVEIRLHTGRHHQIRVQMAHAGMPLAGDRKYGDPGTEEKRLCLCAAKLGFRHPGSGKWMEFRVEPGFGI